MKIDKFSKSEFGMLTTITSPKTGITMFFAGEVGKMWGHTNITQTVSRLLNEGEYKLIKKGDFPDFFKELVDNKMLSAKAQHIQLLTESAVYKLALASNLDKAKPFRDWVASEVLPAIRKTGSYSISDLKFSEIADQTLRTVQLENSKAMNTKNFNESGVPAIIEYNRDNCKQVTGMEPNQIKKIHGKKNKSAKEILRQTQPELAATMSLNDWLIANKNAKLSQLKKLDEAAVTVFKELGKLGMNIIEG